MGEAEVEAAGIGNRTPRPGSLRTRKSLHTRLRALYILNSLYVQDIFLIFPRFSPDFVLVVLTPADL